MSLLPNRRSGEPLLIAMDYVFIPVVWLHRAFTFILSKVTP